MKTLETIQILSKVGKVLSKIIYICCIVGLCGCGVGLVALCIGADVVKFGGLTLHSILEAEAGISTGTVLASVLAGAILCVGELVVSRMACRYFENELAAGTPFTFDGAKELLHLGIRLIWIPIVTVVIAQVSHGIIDQFFTNVEKLDLDGYTSVALGVMCILMSLLCKYGAECRENRENDLP